MPVSDKPKHRNRPFTYRNLKRVPWKNVAEEIEISLAITLRTSADPNTLCKWFLDSFVVTLISMHHRFNEKVFTRNAHFSTTIS